MGAYVILLHRGTNGEQRSGRDVDAQSRRAPPDLTDTVGSIGSRPDQGGWAETLVGDDYVPWGLEREPAQFVSRSFAGRCSSF